MSANYIHFLSGHSVAHDTNGKQKNETWHCSPVDDTSSFSSLKRHHSEVSDADVNLITVLILRQQQTTVNVYSTTTVNQPTHWVHKTLWWVNQLATAW